MMTDIEIQSLGMRVLSQNLGLVESERFIGLIQRENFDYTLWRRENLPEGDVKAISTAAMALRKKDTEKI